MTAHSKPIFLCVLLSLPRLTTLSFNRTFSVNYCFSIYVYRSVALRRLVTELCGSPVGRFGQPSSRKNDYLIMRLKQSIPVITRSKVWVCCRLLAGIVGSNPADDMNVSLLWMLWVLQVQASAKGQSLVQRSPTKC